jgi:HPt (histidine-containing phosphotransfer) domain-containing protein
MLRIQPVPSSPAPTAKSEPEPDVLDRSIINGLKELREPGQPDPLKELVELFFKDAQPRLQLMEEAAAAGDLPTLGAAAHTLKGSASNLGARRLATLCASLEKQAKETETAKAAKTLAGVKAELERVRELLTTELEN